MHKVELMSNSPAIKRLDEKLEKDVKRFEALLVKLKTKESEVKNHLDSLTQEIYTTMDEVENDISDMMTKLKKSKGGKRKHK